ncbi:MAG TPA: hypothetical protein VGL77_06485 [Armatimonadota bacterium]|jgi:hypothetical protein
MAADPPDIEHLLGHWVYNPHLSVFDRLVFCADGRGLLFVGLSGEMAPYIDEFSWTVENDGLLRMTWLVCHDAGATSERCLFAIDVLMNRTPCEVISAPAIDEETGRKTLQQYVFRPLPEKYLYVDFRHYPAIDELWRYGGPAGIFSDEKAALESYLTQFNSADALAGMNRTRETAERMAVALARIQARLATGETAIVVHESETPAATRSAEAFSPWGANPGLKLLLIFGALGLTALIADFPKRGVIPVWLVLPVVLLSVALLMLCWNPAALESEKSQRFAHRLLRIGAYWYLALCALSLCVVTTGWQPRGWWFFLLVIACGLIPVLHRLRK